MLALTVIVFLNGAFGIGKTSVARELVKLLPRSSLFDPEMIGLPIQRLSRLVGRDVPDFQDLPLWRRASVHALRAAHTMSPTIVVPMAISTERYLREIREGLERYGAETRHFCLVAPVSVVEARLARRGATREKNEWEFRRAAECCVAHTAAGFTVQVDASVRKPAELAAYIAGLLSHPGDQLSATEASLT